MKTLVGISTYGLPGFTREAVKSLYETVENQFDVCIVVGNPKDEETKYYSESNGFHTIVHNRNMGFPYSVNDIYEHAWVKGDYDNVVIMGNDVIAYPYAVDSLIDTAREGKYEWICSTQYDVRSLLLQFPHLGKHFGHNYSFTDWGSDPWRNFKGYVKEREVVEIGLTDVQNLCLYTRGAFDKIGYTDANFYPAYYIDNDYARRGVNAEVAACTLGNSVYFHFWSRTIKQGEGGSTSQQFARNRSFYIKKWGGDFGQEKWKIPYGGNTSSLNAEIPLEPTLNIQSREYEERIVDYWRAQ